MRCLRTIPLGSLVLSCALGGVTMLSGCTDETTQNGTLAPFDAEKQKIGQDKMREFMQNKAKGSTSGTGKTK